MSALKPAVSLSRLLKSLPLLLPLAVLTGGGRVFPGRCPQYQPVEDIQFPPILGKWYVFAEFIENIYTIQCHRIEFSSPRRDKFSGFSRRKFGIIDIAEVLSAGKLVYDRPRRSRRLSLAQFLPNTTVGSYNATPYPNKIDPVPPATYHILHVEYNRTAIIWSCEDGEDPRTNTTVNLQFLYVLTRDPTPDQEQIDSIYHNASMLGLETHLWEEIDQANCNYNNTRRN